MSGSEVARYELHGELLAVHEIAGLCGMTLGMVETRLRKGVGVEAIVAEGARRARETSPRGKGWSAHPGDRHGRLVLVREIDRRTAAGKRIFLFLCDCGNEKELIGADVRSGQAQSCGCLRAEGASARSSARVEDLSGRSFSGGTITAVRLSETTRQSKGKGSKYTIRLWECVCRCGAPVFATAASLKLGQVSGCGCVHRERNVLAQRRRAERVEVFGEALTLDDIAQAGGNEKETIRHRLKVRGLPAEVAAFGKPRRGGRRGVMRGDVPHRCGRCGGPGHNARSCGARAPA